MTFYPSQAAPDGFCQPFLNVLKTGSWWTGDATKDFDPTLCDSNGYPQTMNGNFRLVSQCSVPHNDQYSGTYNLYVSGTNVSLEIGGVTPSFGPLTGTRVLAGTFPAGVNADQGGMIVKLISLTDLSEIIICKTGDAAATLANPNAFNPDYLNIVNKFGVLRHMDNGGNQVNMSDDKPATYYSFAAAYFKPLYWCGAITQTGGGGFNNLDYTATLSGFTLTDKAIIQGIVDKPSGFSSLPLASVTIGNPTVLNFNSDPSSLFQVGRQLYIEGLLSNPIGTISDLLSWQFFTITNVNGGAKTVSINVDTTAATGTFGGNTTVSPVATLTVNGGSTKPIGSFIAQAGGGGPQPLNGTPNSTHASTLIYDEQLNVWIAYDEAFGSHGITSGNTDLLIELHNVTNNHPWFSINYLCLDGVGQTPYENGKIPTYLNDLAVKCRNQLNSSLVPRYEPTNECWDHGQFPSTQYAWRRQLNRNNGLGGSNPYLGTSISVFDTADWYGQAVSVVGQIVNNAYNGDWSRYQVICAFQTASQGTDVLGTNGGGRLNSPIYVQYTSSAKVAYKWCTHVCCATYWDSMWYNSAYEESSTQLTAGASAGATLVNVFSTSGMVVGRGLGLVLNSGSVQTVTITALNTPSAGDVQFAEPLTGPTSAFFPATFGLADDYVLAGGTTTYSVVNATTDGILQYYLAAARAPQAQISSNVLAGATVIPLTGTRGFDNFPSMRVSIFLNTSVTEWYTIQSVNHTNKTITLTTGLSADSNAGHPVGGTAKDYYNPSTFLELFSGLSGTFPIAGNVNLYYNTYRDIGLLYTNNAGNHLPVNAYEGGYTPDYSGFTNVRILRSASRYHPSQTSLTTENIRAFREFGEYPSEFSIAGGNMPSLASDTIWEIFSPNEYSTPNARWQGILDAIEGDTTDRVLGISSGYGVFRSHPTSVPET